MSERSASMFPHLDPIEFGGARYRVADVLAVLEPEISEERWARIAEVVARRSWDVVGVCDNPYDMGNAAAVMRSAEAMGAGELHVVQLHTKTKRSQRVTAGADKWLDVRTWDERPGCIAELKARGYRIAATSLGPGAVALGELDFTIPTALVFGNERDGVSPAFLEAADVRCVIPMYGFAESFNLSVAAAIAFYHAAADRVRRTGRHANLSAEERAILRARYALRALGGARAIVAERCAPDRAVGARRPPKLH